MADTQKRQEHVATQLAEAQGSLAVLRRKAAAYDTERSALTLVHGSWSDSYMQPQRLMLPSTDAARVGALGDRSSHMRIFEMH